MCKFLYARGSGKTLLGLTYALHEASEFQDLSVEEIYRILLYGLNESNEKIGVKTMKECSLVLYDDDGEPILEEKEYEVLLKVSGYFLWKGLAKRRDDAINFAYDKWYETDFGALIDPEATVKRVEGD